MLEDESLDETVLRTWIGREAVVTDTVSCDLANRFSATFGLKQNFSFGQVAPPLFHFCLAQPMVPMDQIGEDGHPKRGDFLPSLPLPRRMWAAGKVEFRGALHVGESIRRVSKIADIALKEGRSGKLCFVSVDHTIEARGRIIVAERQDIVYRAAEAGSSPPQTVSPAAIGTHRRMVEPKAVMLFRYSALTFNGHRIHYDKPYACNVEGYPGLVVHGPLQATLLISLATELKGRSPSQFSFRSQSPIFDNKPFFLNAEDVEGKLRLWTSVDGGPAAMTAEATWQ